MKLFCETFNSSGYFQVVRENTNISSDLVRTRQKQLENFLTSAENATLFITNMYISHRKMMYNHVSDVDIVSDLQNSQLRTHQTSQLTKSHSENVL